VSAERVDLLIRSLDVAVDPPAGFVDETYDLLSALVAKRRRAPWFRLVSSMAALMSPRRTALAPIVVAVALLALLAFALALAAARPQPPPSGPSLLYTTYTGSGAGTTLFRLADLASPAPTPVAGVAFRRPSQSPDGRYFASWSDQRGTLEVVDTVKGTVGSYHAQVGLGSLTYGPISLDWSADSTRLALQYDGHSGGCDSALFDAGTGTFRHITDRCLGAVRLSADGRLLAFDRDDGQGAIEPGTLLDLDTGAETALGGRPRAWSQAGHDLLVERSTGIEILAADTATARPLADPCRSGDHEWSGAGALLCHDLDGALWLVPIDGRPAARLAAAGDGATLSPTGDLVMFSVPLTDESSEIWTVRTDGTDRRRVVERSAGWGAFSPDGRQIAFPRASTADAQDIDLYVIESDGTGERLVATGINWFAWSTR
jgi:hypothetical protein